MPLADAGNDDAWPTWVRRHYGARPTDPAAAAGHPDDARPTWVRWRIVALLMAISFLNYFNRISMPVAGGRIMRDYAIDEVQMGWVYSALLIAYTLFMLPGGWFSDRWGGRVALATMGLGTAVFCALTGLVGYPLIALGLVWPVLLVVRALMGAFTAPLYPAAGRVVSRWIALRHRALANGLVTGAGMMGIVLAYPLFGGLMVAFGWPNAFLITGVVTAVLAGLWVWYGRDNPAQHPAVNRAELAMTAWSGPLTAADRRTGTTEPTPSATISRAQGPPLVPTWRSLVRSRSLWLLTACYATIGYIEYLVFYWSEYYFKQVLHFSERQSQFAAMVPPLMMALGIPLGGWLADRLMGAIGYRQARALVAGGGMVGCAGFLWAGTTIAHPVAIVACFALSLGAIGLCEGSAWATAIDLGGLRGGTSAALVNTGGNVGGFLSPVVTPWVGMLLSPSLGRELGWAWGIRLGCLICLLGAGLWFWIDARERPRESAATAPTPKPVTSVDFD